MFKKCGLRHHKPTPLSCIVCAKLYSINITPYSLQVPTIAYCTGEKGLVSQLLSFKFGGFWAYGSIEGNAIPGIPSIESLKRAYGVTNIDKNTQVFGLISKPVSHSKGPILHNPTFLI